MRNLTRIYQVKMEYVSIITNFGLKLAQFRGLCEKNIIRSKSKITIFGLKMMVKDGLEKRRF